MQRSRSRERSAAAVQWRSNKRPQLSTATSPAVASACRLPPLARHPSRAIASRSVDRSAHALARCVAPGPPMRLSLRTSSRSTCAHSSGAAATTRPAHDDGTARHGMARLLVRASAPRRRSSNPSGHATARVSLHVCNKPPATPHSVQAGTTHVAAVTSAADEPPSPRRGALVRPYRAHPPVHRPSSCCTDAACASPAVQSVFLAARGTVRPTSNAHSAANSIPTYR